MEVTKWLKPSISVSQIGDSASVQAATRVNAEQSSKRTMRRSTRQPYRGRLIRLDEMSEANRPRSTPDNRARCPRDRGFAAGRRARRSDDAGADRRDASAQPSRPAGVRHVTQGSPLGTPE